MHGLQGHAAAALQSCVFQLMILAPLAKADRRQESSDQGPLPCRTARLERESCGNSCALAVRSSHLPCLLQRPAHRRDRSEGTIASPLKHLLGVKTCEPHISCLTYTEWNCFLLWCSLHGLQVAKALLRQAPQYKRYCSPACAQADSHAALTASVHGRLDGAAARVKVLSLPPPHQIVHSRQEYHEWAMSKCA